MADKKKIKEVISKLKKLKGKKVPGVEEPKKPRTSNKHVEEAHSHMHEHGGGPAMSGPKGGTFRVSPSGKKYYEHKNRITKGLDEYYQQLEEIDRFINQFKDFKGLQ